MNQQEKFVPLTAEIELSSFKESEDKATSSAIEQLKDKLTAQQYAFLLGQLRISEMFGKCRGWTKDEMSAVLKIYNHSPEAYNLMKKSLFFPSKLTLKRFTFDDPKLEELVKTMEYDDSDLSEDTLSSSDHQQDSDEDIILEKALKEEGLPKISNVISLADHRSDKLLHKINETKINFKRKICPSQESPEGEEYEEERRKVLMKQIQCQMETSNRKCELLLQRSKQKKQKNSQLSLMLMLAGEIAKENKLIKKANT